MLKGILGILLFVFFLIVFFVFLIWGYIVRTIRNYRRAFKVKSEREEIHYRNETGRQRQQYSQRPQPGNSNYEPGNGNYEADNGSQQPGNGEQEQARRTQTATGETIIDHRHQERADKKIFEDSDGEYVEFTEES